MSKGVWAEVVTIGSELVLGQLVDTNAAFIARALAGIGVGLAFHSTVGDDRAHMATALRTALDRCSIVITTGGIGPTEDDLTREMAAEVLGRELVMKPELLEFIEGLFRRLGYSMTPNNRRQAYIPDGAVAIHNPRGTAPAFRYELDDKVLICLPGVPKETEPLILEAVIPYLKEKYRLDNNVWVNRVLKVSGLGESAVDAQLKDLILTSENPVIGLQASPGEIKVRLTAKAANTSEAEVLLDQTEARVREQLGSLIYGYGDETLAGNTARMLEQTGLTLAVGETVTAGLVAAELGRRLSDGRLKTGLIRGLEAQKSGLLKRLREEPQADLVLTVTGTPDENDRIRVEIQVEHASGKRKVRELSLGGPIRMIRERASTAALFILFSFIRKECGGTGAGVSRD